MLSGWWDRAGKCSVSFGVFGSILVVPFPSSLLLEDTASPACQCWADEAWVRKMLGRF